MRVTPARILITGATGFLGRVLVESVRVRWPAARLTLLVRDRARAVQSGLPAADLVEGSLESASALPDAAAFDVAVHLAGAVKGRRDQLLHTNGDATARWLQALSPRTRVILVSSLAAAGPSLDGSGTAAPPDACRPCSDYGESKRRGELALLADAARTGRAFVVLRPCLVYGPGDAATALLAKQAVAPLCPVPWRPRPLSTLHVSDAVAAICAAIERSAVAGVFLPIGGEVTDSHALLVAIAHARGRRARLLRVPGMAAALAGHAADLMARVRGASSYFSRDKVREITAPGWVADRQPARASLGFVAKLTLAEGLAQTLRGA